MEKLDISTSSALLATSDFASIAGSIYHTTSKQTNRYFKSSKVSLQDIMITAGEFSSCSKISPNYLPPQWAAHNHPEGQLYFSKDATIRVVTEAYVYDGNVMEKVEHWIKVVEDLVPQKQIVLSDDVELFIQIEGNDCFYYFVDHRSRTEFWLDNVDTNEIGLEPVVSTTHLRVALEELYWIHVEYFPTHSEGLVPHVLEELIGVFSHALADQMTSRTSTFPYDARECTTFLQLLQSFKGHMQNAYAQCVIARLWQLVFKNRFETLYGEQNARLCRDHSILVDTARESRLLRVVTTLLTFGTSDTYVSRLNDIYVDHLVYTHQWQPFMKQSLKEWRSLSYLSFLAPLCCFLFFFMPTLRLFSVLSALCFWTSFISSILLTHRHETLKNATANDALIYLNDVRSDRFKFQWVAFAYALPKTSFLWGVIYYTFNCFVAAAVLVVGGAVWLPYFLAIVITSFLAIIVFQSATSGNKVLGISILRWTRGGKYESSPV